MLGYHFILSKLSNMLGVPEKGLLFEQAPESNGLAFSDQVRPCEEPPEWLLPPPLCEPPLLWDPPPLLWEPPPPPELWLGAE
jgi:hypothetical protein